MSFTNLGRADGSENIDPTSSRTDAELNDALNLIHDKSEASSSLRDKFRLDGTVQNEGANFSAGERQLREAEVPVSTLSLQSPWSAPWLVDVKSSCSTKRPPLSIRRQTR